MEYGVGVKEFENALTCSSAIICVRIDEKDQKMIARTKELRLVQKLGKTSGIDSRGIEATH